MINKVQLTHSNSKEKGPSADQPQRHHPLTQIDRSYSILPKYREGESQDAEL